MEQLTASQLAEWEEYSKLDPIGEQRADYRLSYLLMTITNLAISVHGKKGSKLTKIEDYLLDWDAGREKEVKQQSVEDMKNFLLGFAQKQNQKVTKTDAKNIKK